MARGYRPVNRDQQFLLPPDPRDWLPADHLVWFVLDTVEALDTTALHDRYRTGGVGRAAYDPDMLLALVMYGWSQAVRSSRRIERLCAVDVAFRVICAGDVPDHTTVSRFVAGCEEVVAGLFAQVLGLCRAAGLVRVGTVAIDGTKIAADASLRANRSRKTLEAELAGGGDDPVVAQAARVVAQQVAQDSAEDAQFGVDKVGDELPTGLAKRSGRPARIRRALEELQARTPPAPVRVARPEVLETGHRKGGRIPKDVDGVAEAEAVLAQVRAQEHAHHDQVVAARAAQRAAGKRPAGREPTDPDTHDRVRRAQTSLDNAHIRAAATAARDAKKAAAADRVNVTDPDSRIMTSRKGTIQGYNCQTAVTADHIILATDVTNDPTDTQQFPGMLDQAIAAAAALPAAEPDPAAIGTVLADSGYDSDANLTHPGPDRLIAPRIKDATERSTPERARIAERLATPAGKNLYNQRAATVEPVNGHIKDSTGLRRFRRRGLPAVTAEFTLTATILNLQKLFRATHPATT